MIQPLHPFLYRYKNGTPYKLANLFMLGHPYGHPKVMSSYAFNNHDQGPPGSRVHSGSNVDCGNGNWVCEHRWPEIAAMVNFRKVAGTSSLDNFQTGQNNRGVAFSRGNAAFLAINLSDQDWQSSFQSGLVRAISFKATCETICLSGVTSHTRYTQSAT